MFTPPSVRGAGPNDNQGTIQLPGSQGGADVQGAAFDPETNYLYIPSITSPFVADILEGNPDRTNLAFIKGTRQWIGGPRGLPLFKPPYGRITAFDMNTGEDVWMVPNGYGPTDHPAIAHLNLGRLGSPGRPGPLLTKTLLFLGEGSDVGIRAGGRVDGRHAAQHRDQLRRAVVQGLRQGDRRRRLGDGTQGGDDRRPDDLPARGQAVRRRADRGPRGSRPVGRAQPAVTGAVRFGLSG